MQPLVILNTVGLTSRLLPLAPRLHALAQAQWSRPLGEVLPAVTCTAQASMLTGKLPQEHGIVGNGWLYKDTMEVRFWQQSNRLIQAEPVYKTLALRGVHTAKIFWWFNQGADVRLAVTPKPHYGADGSKAFDVQSYPANWAGKVIPRIGSFPFPSFWGPMAGLASTQWIAQCAAEAIVEDDKFLNLGQGLTLVYLPHLDYQPQKIGPANCDWKKLVGDLDAACAPILDAAKKMGSNVWIVNEYTHLEVDQPIYLNRILRQAGGLLALRDGPFGEQLDIFACTAFAVCDHQIAHVYCALDVNYLERLRKLLVHQNGVDRVYVREERAELGLNHPRAGDLVVLAKPNAWFAYPFWLDDAKAPDYARTVDIHRKPGYDPCELFFDPKLFWPKGRAIAKVLMKKLGLRTLVDVIPLDASLVKGSHGLAVSDPLDKPVFIGSGPAPQETIVPQTAIRDHILRHFGC